MATLQLTSYDLATTYAQVLMPVDYSPPSWNLLPTARHLAEAFGVPMNVLHVDTETHWRDAGDSQQVEHVTPSGEVVRVSDVAERDAPTGITRALGDDESSLLVMPTHGHAGFAELAMGGTANEILRRWQGPLLTSGPQFRVGGGRIRRIVMCVGPSATSTALVVDVGRWARIMQARVELLSVTKPGSGTAFSDVQEAHARLQELAALLPAGAPAPVTVRLQGARASHEIVSYVDQVPGTVVAMATRARSAPQHALLGSVATAVLRNSKSLVLLRRADAAPGRNEGSLR